MSKIIAVFLSFFIFDLALAQVPAFGKCPNVTTVSSLDISQYLGRWYEAERYFAFFEIGGRCVTADYSMGENGTIKVVNSQISSITGSNSSAQGVARIPDPSEPGKLKVQISSVPFGIEGNYWVLGTDYTSYSVVYSCTNLEVANLKYAWILTRARNPSESVIEKAAQVIKDNNISRSSFSKTDQNKCDN